MSALIALALSPARADHASDEALALDLNRRSKELYREGHYAEAALLLREAYRLKREPVLQYNLARTCEKMADYACAIAAYEGYLADAAPADRDTIEARLAFCRAQAAGGPAPAPASTVPPASSPLDARSLSPVPQRAERLRVPALPPTERSRSTLSVIASGVGVVGLGAGIGLVSAAYWKHHEAREDLTQRGRAEKQERAESLMLAGHVSLIAGGAVTAGALLWWILDARSSRPPAPPPAGTARLQVGVASVALGLTF